MDNNEVNVVLNIVDFTTKEARNLSEKENISYDQATNIVRNKNGIHDVKEIPTLKNFGTPTYEYTTAVNNFGEEINGKRTDSYGTEELTAFNTAAELGIDLKKVLAENGMENLKVNADLVRRLSVGEYYKESRVRKNDKVYVLRKEDANGIKAA